MTLYTDGAYTFADIDADYVALYAFDNSSDTLVIPQRYNTQYVSSIYDYAFKDNKVIKTIDFTANKKRLNTIGVKSFMNTNLTGELNLPASVHNLGLGAFQECDSITTAQINSNVKEIPAQLFYSCDNLETVYIPITAESIGNLAFADCPKLEDVYFPSSVTSISESAFNNSTKVVFNCFKNTYVHQYAVSHNISVELLDPEQGDANCNGVLDINDATTIQKSVAGIKQLSKTGSRAADVNGDGNITVRDATLIQMRLANIITDFN